MHTYSNTKKSSSTDKRAITEMALLEKLAHYYIEKGGEIYYDRTSNNWKRFNHNNLKSDVVSNRELYFDILHILGDFRDKLVTEDDLVSEKVDKLIKHIFRVHNIEVIPNFLAMFLCKEEE